MKARRAKAWACSHCGNVYRDSEHGKEKANACCSCPSCGLMGSHFGASTLCAPCWERKELERARENLEHARERLAKAEKKVARS